MNRGGGSETHASLESREIAENVGRLVLVWTHVENASHVILWGVIDQNRAINDSRPLTVGQSLDWVWNTTQQLLSHKSDSEELVEWFAAWRLRAIEGRRKRNEAVHGWWLPTGDERDPFKVLDVVSRKARSAYREDVIPGGSSTLTQWIDEISVIQSDLLYWWKEILVPYLQRDAAARRKP